MERTCTMRAARATSPLLRCVTQVRRTAPTNPHEQLTYHVAEDDYLADPLVFEPKLATWARASRRPQRGRVRPHALEHARDVRRCPCPKRTLFATRLGARRARLPALAGTHIMTTRTSAPTSQPAPRTWHRSSRRHDRWRSMRGPDHSQGGSRP